MLTLYFHPLSSYSWKALIALYENEIAFSPFVVDQNSYAEFKALWPLAKFPVLRDGKTIIPEASLIIEHLDTHHRGHTRFLPDEADAAIAVRLWDRVFDNYVMTPMSKIIADILRPEGKRDPYGVEEARALLRTAYDMIEAQLKGRAFIAGDAFSMADCAAAPSLYYAVRNEPLAASHVATAAYLERLKQRPSFARALQEAQPFFHLYPGA